MPSGIFITFEGIECCGKSTQLSLLAKWLTERGHHVLTTREPGGTSLGENIRSLLNSGRKEDCFSVRAELLLFEASRAQHMEEKILPALEKGFIVLCDRFTDSTLVYQGVARHIPQEIILSLNAFASFERSPDITFLPDISVEESFQRLSRRGAPPDRFEQENRAFFEQVRAGYLEEARQHPRFVLLPGELSTEVISQKIIYELQQRFPAI